MDRKEKCRQEKDMIEKMIQIYCKGNHKETSGCLCKTCNGLKEYAWMKTEKCPFMETKTFCSACKVHCYSKEMQEQIRIVMRYSGPRMLWIHPVITLRHMKTTIRKKRKEARHV